MKKKGYLFLPLAMAAAMAVGCAGASASKEDGKADGKNAVDERKTIAYCTLGVDSDYWYLMERGVAKACEDLGYDYIMQDHKEDEALMVSTCQNLLNQDIDGLIVSPIKPEALPPIVENAHMKEIPVIIGDMGDGDSDDDGLIMSDNYAGGVMTSSYIRDLFEKEEPASRDYAVVRLQPEAAISQFRCDSAIDVMTEAGYTCVSDNYSKGGTTEEGLSIMQDIIAAHPDICAVFCGNDRLAVGVAQAAKIAGLNDIKIAGFDADESGIEALKTEAIACTAQQFSYDIGYECVVAIDKLIRGEAIEYDDEEKKQILVGCAMITKDDIVENPEDQIISSTGLTRKETD